MTSKFRGILDSAKSRDPEPVEPAEPPPATVADPSPAPSEDAPRKRGRPKGGGKKDNPEYDQVTVYLSKAVHLKLRMILLQRGRTQTVSDALEAMAARWIEEHS